MKELSVRRKEQCFRDVWDCCHLGEQKDFIHDLFIWGFGVTFFFFFTFLRVCKEKEKEKGRLCEQVKKQRKKKESMRFLTCTEEEKESLKFKLIENV